MELSVRDMPKIMLDNDVVYINHLTAVVDSVDELASMGISKTSHSYHFRIAPSTPSYSQPLLKEILKLNTLFGIQLDLSKSIRISSTITFDIELSQ